MSPWTCPNTGCTYDKQMQPEQRCQLCGKEAKEFKFGEFGNLLKLKDSFKKSKERTKKTSEPWRGRNSVRNVAPQTSIFPSSTALQFGNV